MRLLYSMLLLMSLGIEQSGFASSYDCDAESFKQYQRCELMARKKWEGLLWNQGPSNEINANDEEVGAALRQFRIDNDIVNCSTVGGGSGGGGLVSGTISTPKGFFGTAWAVLTGGSVYTTSSFSYYQPGFTLPSSEICQHNYYDVGVKDIKMVASYYFQQALKDCGGSYYGCTDEMNKLKKFDAQSASQMGLEVSP
jgi:hypothetical protein